MTNPLGPKVLALLTLGKSYAEVRDELGLRTRGQVAGIALRARIPPNQRSLPRPITYTQRGAFLLTDQMHGELQTLAAQWNCPVCEVIRTMITWGLEDINAND